MQRGEPIVLAGYRPIRYSHRDAGSALSACVGQMWLWQKALWVMAVFSRCALTHSQLYPWLG